MNNKILSFESYNESISNSPADVRLNIFKNFNHINKDQEGGMEIFAPRVNTEINRMSDEVFNLDIEDDDDLSDEGRDEYGGDVDDLLDGYGDEDIGLVINKKDRVSTPRRTLNYPYGVDNSPSPTFKMDSDTQSQSGIVFRFADYRGINNFR